MARSVMAVVHVTAVVVLLSACGKETPRAGDDASPSVAATAAPAGPSTPSTSPVVTAPSVPAAVPACLVTARAVGPLRLGMPIQEAQAAMPTARFTRSSDGEGVALVEVAVDGAPLAVLYAGEEDPETPVDPLRSIEHIETFNAACATAEGVHPGSPVAAAEAAYGAIRSITRSEIESREYIEFAHPPAGLQFRLDYTGEFADGESETTRHAPDAKILSIAISSR